MDELSINYNRRASAEVKRPSRGWLREFWRRQFRQPATREQTVFDVVFGVLLPVVCVVIDPFVFRSFSDETGLLEDYQFFSYSIIALEIPALVLWLTLRERVSTWSRALGGVLLAGGLFSATIGVLLLPFSIIGLVFLIGALGFTPFCSALVYLRNGLRALDLPDAEAEVQSRRASNAPAIVLGIAFVMGATATAQWGISLRVSSVLAEIIEQQSEPSEAKIQELKYAHWLVGNQFDPVVWAYNNEPNPARKARLANIYERATGKDIEHRLSILLD
ncbi:MAG TPA: hypothetical protein VGB73_05700 [Pyrinomonadaceae bacterium]|jgi:hypothetical protein